MSYSKQEIMNLIKKGYDLELISFELEIPIEVILQYKSELVRKNNMNKTRNKNNATHKMQELRKRYQKLFLKTTECEYEQAMEFSEQEQEAINLAILEIETVIEKMKKAELNGEFKRGWKEINSELKKIKGYQLTLNQAERLYQLLSERVLLSKKQGIDNMMERHRIDIARRLARAITTAQFETNDLQALEGIKRKITMQMQKDSPMAFGIARTKIENKISKIKQQEAIDRVKNNISPDIDSIIMGIADGTIDVEKANELIDEEVRKRVEKRPKGKFAITEEQEKRQVLIQIRTALKEKSERYQIKNPETAITKLCELTGDDLSQAIRTIVINLISAKDFERAKEVCDKYDSREKGTSHSKSIRALTEEIKNAEIADFVLKGINRKGTDEEEKSFFELLEKGIRKGNIKLNAIFLGKSQDESRIITLADIWEDEKKTIKQKKEVVRI